MPFSVGGGSKLTDVLRSTASGAPVLDLARPLRSTRRRRRRARARSPACSPHGPTVRARPQGVSRPRATAGHGIPRRCRARRRALGDVDAVAVSTAIPSSNPEVEAARARGIRSCAGRDPAAIAATPVTIARRRHPRQDHESSMRRSSSSKRAAPSFIIARGERDRHRRFGTRASVRRRADESDGTSSSWARRRPC